MLYYVSVLDSGDDKLMSNKKKTFKIGDFVVYPAHGVGKIVEISEKNIMGKPVMLYKIKIIDTEMDVLVPEANIEKVGVRHLLNKKEIEDVYKTLKSKPAPIPSSAWNRRHRVYMDKIKTGNIIEIAEVYRDLASLKAQKILSFGEKKMLDTSKNLLVTEISISLNKDKKEIDDSITSIFGTLNKEDIEIDI